MSKSTKSKTPAKNTDNLLEILRDRFEKNKTRHPGLSWEKVAASIAKSKTASAKLQAMEDSGGEPDVVVFDKKSDQIFFVDCSAESPSGRRSICYDHAAWLSRKEHKPKTSAVELAEEIGIQLLNEEQYRVLQQMGAFDLKTSSWIDTPAPIRKLGGALFCDRRFDHVFTYHNGAESYYAARGFRGWFAL